MTCLDNRGYCDEHYFVSNSNKFGVYRLGDERLALLIEHKEVKVHRFETANGYINVAYICKDEYDKYLSKLELADYFKKINLYATKVIELANELYEF